jgi:hypothetical protein
MRPARAGRPGQGAGGSTNGGKLHSLIGAVWGGQETNPDFTNPGGHDFNDANFDANAQLPFEKQSFADRLMGRPDANQAYTLNRAAAAGALTDAQKLALFQQNLGHQEQTFQENKLGSDLALLAQQQNAGRLNPSLSRPSLSYDLSSGTPQAESPFPVMSPQEYNLMLGSQARQIGIPAAQAVQAHAINARIGAEAERPTVAPIAQATQQGRLSDAQTQAFEAGLHTGYRTSQLGQRLFGQGLQAHDTMPMLAANKAALENADTATQIPMRSMVHLGNGMVLNLANNQLMAATPSEKPGQMEPTFDKAGKATGFQKGKGSPGRLDISTAGQISNPSTGFNYVRKAGAAGAPYAQPNYGVPFPEYGGGAPAGSFTTPEAPPIAPTTPVAAPDESGKGPTSVTPLTPTYGPPAPQPAMDPYGPLNNFLKQLFAPSDKWKNSQIPSYGY